MQKRYQLIERCKDTGKQDGLVERPSTNGFVLIRIIVMLTPVMDLRDLPRIPLAHLIQEKHFLNCHVSSPWLPSSSTHS